MAAEDPADRLDPETSPVEIVPLTAPAPAVHRPAAPIAHHSIADESREPTRRPWAVRLGAGLTVVSIVALVAAVLELVVNPAAEGEAWPLVLAVAIVAVCIAPFLWFWGLGKLVRTSSGGFDGGVDIGGGD